ncbi:MAG: carbamoyltransferase [Candidatus Riflebacteria bacterium]|nr:carbamoyltransferase [Candidatus Riflebacteria bacterium]
MPSRASLVLGINSAYHESAAAIVRGGRLLAAVEEERLTRVKHGKAARIDNPDQLPWQAIEWVLAAAGTHLTAVDAIAYSLVPGRRCLTIGRDPEGVDEAAGFGTEAGELEFDARVRRVPNLVADRAGASELAERVEFVPHHLAHAASAFYPSGFPDAAVLAVDGIGEDATSWLGKGGPRGLTLLEEIPYPHSLGMLWERVAVYLGFTPYDAPKVMGLAAWGDAARFQREVAELLRVPDAGGGEPGGPVPPFLVDAGTAGLRAPDLTGLERVFGPARRPGEPPDGPRFAAVAAALQQRTEEALLATCRRLARSSGSANLAYAGGVALNCVANARLERDGPFERLYLPPAAHDAGTAVGAAFCVAHVLDGQRPRGPVAQDVPPAPFVGPSFDPKRIDAALSSLALPIRPVAQPERTAARMLSRGLLVGWFQGRLELGPRALGHRSLLADPRHEETRRSLNLRIKHREPFRPFGASVLEEDADAWFELPSARPGAAGSRDLMLLAYPVRPHRAADIPAVVHRDGSCRIQCVSRDARFRALLAHFKTLTGVPLVLNTSFNENEPIVSSPEDALRTFQRTGLDALFLEDRLVLRPGVEPGLDEP